MSATTRRLTNMRGGDIPDLTRRLVAFELKVQWCALAHEETELNNHMFEAVGSLQTTNDVMCGADYFLAAWELETLHHYLTHTGLHWAVLNTESGWLGWKQTPKLHNAVAHLARQAALVDHLDAQT